MSLTDSFEANKENCRPLVRKLKRYTKQHLKKKAPHFVKVIKIFTKALGKNNACKLTITAHVLGRCRNKDESTFKKILKMNKPSFKKMIKDKLGDDAVVKFTKIDEEVV